MQEKIVKEFDTTEYLAMLGTFGTVLSAIQVAAIERTEITSVSWTSALWLPILGFVMVLFCNV